MKVRKIMRALLVNTILTDRIPRASHRSIVFSFDDGPHQLITPRVLDILDQYGVKALFFVVGRFAEKQPELVKRIAAKGHRIGNHSYFHWNDRVPGFTEYKSDVRRCQSVIETITGQRPTFFRPPRGIILPQTLLAAWSNRSRIVLWSKQGGEWAERANDEPGEIARALASEIKARDLILLHDDNPKVPVILEELLPLVKKRGFDVSEGVGCLK